MQVSVFPVAGGEIKSSIGNGWLLGVIIKVISGIQNKEMCANGNDANLLLLRSNPTLTPPQPLPFSEKMGEGVLRKMEGERLP